MNSAELSSYPGEYSQEHLLNVKEEYADLPERDHGKHWYDQIKLPSSISKKGKRSHSPRFDEFTLRHFKAWMEDRLRKRFFATSCLAPACSQRVDRIV